MMLKTEPGGRIDYSERKWENRRRRRRRWPKLASQLHSALPESGQTSTTAAVSSPLLLRSPSPPSLAHALQSPLHLHGSINDASERAIEGGSCGSRDKLSSRRRDGARRRARALPCNDSSRNNSTIRTRPSIHPSSGRAAESPLQRCCSASRDSGDRENSGSLLP